MKCPFPLPAIPKGNVTKVYDPHGTIRELLDYIDCAMRNDAIFVGSIVGNYGFGKTHILLYVKNYIESHYKKAFTVYVPSPGMSFKDLYKIIMNKVLSIIESQPKIANQSGSTLGIALKVIVSNSDSSYFIRQWILGESVPLKYRQKYGLGSNLNDEKSLNLLLEALRLMRDAGFSPIAILIDEVENIATYASVKKLRYLNYLREMLDLLVPQSVLLVASTPAGWNEIINTHPALARRLSSYVLYLKPFNKEQVREFLKFYIGKDSIDSEWLLSDPIVDAIYEYSNGNPGEVLKFAYLLYMYAKTNNERELDSEIAKEVISKYV